ncbi:NAD(+) salvage pathway protein [Yamadazyma tenuis]|uniref:nicotinamidase n=1 Tax=Candida tenuis (strain ATCC 10573 / BCRC 21748 / CBS 615 / JCM 9827 / NBRC 10315 / NRRL Y-1498 / VKM Y-70) TaxID=590646 RepID=G3BA20_CANTC|nr:Isochorismatase hydrolase [Yamadazyma tenuis ATCC 10573]XP_006688911.1 uncharacterized protein CANTEDRAFT_115446 [Yamadazyma tenuis ATCC 10573]EGV62740.1 Isochorismatase hydrolase [Yamadazyma tenuis ATCC 10573]EGV62741.1 hypothetical protein CANTEDRAFT_115446 [Yamadazyma tenuis ATCC 10573]WEJ93243.1 NAD(+) salvage pathway protein [Yamadazyma tenuis]
MNKPALVVIDLQEDFLPSDGSLAVAGGRSIVEGIIDLLDVQKFPWAAVIATQDWHPHDHISFASQHSVEPYSQLEFTHPLGEKDETGSVKTLTQTVWPDHCVQNTFGSSIDAAFLTQFNQVDGKVPKAIVQKGYLKDREYYSCFKDTWKLHKTEMEDTLRKLEVTDVIFVGLAYDFCVMNSAVDCSQSGFTTYVIKSLCKSVFPENISQTDDTYRNGGVKILESIDDYSF